MNQVFVFCGHKEYLLHQYVIHVVEKIVKRETSKNQSIGQNFSG